MKRLILLILLGSLACGLLPTPQPTLAPTAAATPVPTATAAAPDAALGSAKNPLILALPPSARPTGDVINAGNVLKSLLEKSTGFKIIVVAPPAESELVKAFADGNAHIGVLSPFGYLMASNSGKADAAFARQRDGGIFYGAQFIVQSEAGFTSYFDPVKNENTADASAALVQFNDKKPCWTDTLSPSGYVVPLGLLSEVNVKPLEPAFVSGHSTVVRAVYARGICDFGATYIDARTYPGLENEFPDVMKKVNVVWRIPAIIPYETLVFAHGMTIDTRRALERAFVDAMSTPGGKSAMQVLYGFDAMQIVQNGQYDEFRKAVKASGLDLGDLVK